MVVGIVILLAMKFIFYNSFNFNAMEIYLINLKYHQNIYKIVVHTGCFTNSLFFKILENASCVQYTTYLNK